MTGSPDSAPPGVDTVITVGFSEQDGWTIQTFHQTPFFHAKGRDEHIQGWNSLFAREQAYAKTLHGLHA